MRKRGRFRFDFLLFERLPRHCQRGDFRHRQPRRFGNKRRGARCARIDFQNINLAAADRKLHIHQADDAQPFGERARLPFEFGDNVRRQRMRRQRTRRIAGVNAGAFNVFHHARDQTRAFPVAHGVNINFNGVRQKLVQQHFAVQVADNDGAAVFFQFFFAVDDAHCAPAEDITRAHDERIADLFGGGAHLFPARQRRDGVLRLAQL